MTREARTEPIPHAQPEPAEATPGTAPDAHSVTLSDGRVCLLAENNAYQARVARKAILRMGINPTSDQADFILAMALYSIVSIDGETFKPPSTDMMFNAFLMDGVSESDTYKLVRAYTTLLGEGDPADKSFREGV